MAEVLSGEDETFVAYVRDELDAFLRCEQSAEAIALFPPNNSYKRRLIHRVVEEKFASSGLGTFSVGEEPRRRTAVGKKCPVRRGVVPETAKSRSVGRRRERTTVYVPPHRRETSQTQDDSWEPLYCGKGVCTTPDLFVPVVDEQEMREIVSEFGCVKLVELKGFAGPNTKTEDDDQEEEDGGSSILEIYELPDNTRSDDLARIFGDFVGRGFRLRWVNGATALAIFSSPATASEALDSAFTEVRVRRLSEATSVSVEAAKHVVLPSSMRPRTCTSLARRLLSRALGPQPAD